MPRGRPHGSTLPEDYYGRKVRSDGLVWAKVAPYHTAEGKLSTKRLTRRDTDPTLTPTKEKADDYRYRGGQSREEYGKGNQQRDESSDQKDESSEREEESQEESSESTTERRRGKDYRGTYQDAKGHARVYQYGSVSEYLDAALNDKTRRAVNQRWVDEIMSMSRHHYGNETKWYGIPKPESFKAIVDLINDGWKDGAERVERLANQFVLPPLESSKRQQRWCDEGDDFDRDRMYRGDIESMWRKSVRMSRRAPGRYRIVADICASGSIEGEEFFWPGAAALAMTDLLENAGHRVELVAAFRTTPGYKDGATQLQCEVTVKSFETPLNIEALAAQMCLAATFRTVGFAWFVKHYEQATNAGYGVCVALKRKFVSEENSECFLVPQDTRSKKAAISWMREILAYVQGEGAEPEVQDSIYD